MPTFPLKLSKDEHATLKRRAEATGLSIHAYLKALALDGTLPKAKRTK